MDPQDFISLHCICSHVAKQSLSKQDTTISVVQQLRQLELAEMVRFQVSAVFHFLFLYLSLFRIAVICLVVCKGGRPTDITYKGVDKTAPTHRVRWR